MDKDTINQLRGLVYQYTNEPRNTYTGGHTMVVWELNKTKFEQLSGFVNWIEHTNSKSVELKGQNQAEKPKKLAPESLEARDE